MIILNRLLLRVCGNMGSKQRHKSRCQRRSRHLFHVEQLEDRNLLTAVFIDNGDLGYASSGAWSTYTGGGFQSDIQWTEPGDGDTASWTFNVTPGASYQVSATWLNHATLAADSPFTIFDGGTPITTVTLSQQVLPSQFSDAGAVWDDLVSSLTVSGNTLTVELSDLASGRVAADAIRVEELVPEIEVSEGVTVIPDGSGSVSFGSTIVGRSVSKTFAVNNVGTADLTLTPPITLPTGFHLVSSFGTTTLAPGSSTTFVVELDTSDVGSFSGEISFGNDDSDENPFNFAIDGSVGLPVPVIIDNGDPGYSSIGPWNDVSTEGYQGDYQWIDAGDGDIATWTFNVNPGSTYRISATWHGDPTAADNAAYSIFDGTTPVVSSAYYNQTVAPTLFPDQGGMWNDLMSSVTVSSSTLTVGLSNERVRSWVIADAIRVEELVVLPGPEIDVVDGATNSAASVPDDIGAISFGPTSLGHSVAKTFTVNNLGTEDLILTSPITVPTGFNVVRSFGSTTLLPGESTSFVVELDASNGGSFSGEISFGTNDADESPFNFAIDGSVALPVPTITDNVDSNFSLSGDWLTFNGGGYQGTVNGTEPGDGDTATWTFDVIPGASYQVSATWFSHPTLGTDSPFTIFDDGTPVTTGNLNQQVAPSQFSDAGVMWNDLESSVTVSGSTLTVELTDLADGRVAADAVRIQQVEPSALVTYVDVAADVGIELSHQLAPICWPPIGSGCAWADYNNDGRIDFMVTSQRGANHLYRNDGDTSGDGLPNFTDVAVAAGVDNPTGVSLSAVFIDYDNDGDQDLYVSNWGGNTLYQNQLIETGSAVFTDVTAFAGLVDGGRAITSAWGDFDQDGHLDVYLAKHFYCNVDPQSEDHLYRSNGDGTFTDVSSWLGGGGVQLSGLGFSPGWVDYDNDGDSDLYLVNDNILGVNYPNVLWRNDGPDGAGGWIFTDVSVSSGTDISLNGMGLGIGDYDNDGFFDFAFSNIGQNYLLDNQGDGTFDDVSAVAGIERTLTPAGPESVTWGTAFFDHDNDGLLDLLYVAGNIPDLATLQPNAFFANNGDGTFTDISARSGLDDPGNARGAAMVDFDQDGFVDIFVGNYGEAPKLYHNASSQLGNTNQWLSVTVEGTVSNRDGIGARLTLVTPNGVSQIREITSGPTHGGGDYRAAYFGLGDQTSGDLVVRWPNGVVENIGSVTAGQQLHLIEPVPEAGLSAIGAISDASAMSVAVAGLADFAGTSTSNGSGIFDAIPLLPNDRWGGRFSTLLKNAAAGGVGLLNAADANDELIVARPSAETVEAELALGLEVIKEDPLASDAVFAALGEDSDSEEERQRRKRRGQTDRGA